MKVRSLSVAAVITTLLLLVVVQAQSALAPHVLIDIRPRVLTLGGASAVVFGRHIPATSAQTIVIEKRVIGEKAWTKVSTTESLTLGVFGYSVRPRVVTDYRARWRNSASAVLRLPVRPSVSFVGLDKSITIKDSTTLRADIRGNAASGIPMVLERKNGARWDRISSRVSDGWGVVDFRLSPSVSTTYRVRTTSTLLSNATSKNVTVAVRPKITLQANKERVPLRTTIKFSGKLAPVTRRSVSIQTWTGGKWQTQVTATVSTTTGAYAATWAASSKGTYRVRAFVEATSKMAAAASYDLENKFVFPVGGDKSRIYWQRRAWTRGKARAGLVHHDYPASDIMSPYGFPIYAALTGTVSAVRYGGESTKGGNTVTIKSDRGLVLFNAHLKTISVSQNQKVLAGRKIGTVGASGNASADAPHLHLGMSRPGGSISGDVDPFPYLNPAWSSTFIASPLDLVKKIVIY